jgi:hypothetical protein
MLVILTYAHTHNPSLGFYLDQQFSDNVFSLGAVKPFILAIYLVTNVTDQLVMSILYTLPLVDDEFSPLGIKLIFFTVLVMNLKCINPLHTLSNQNSPKVYMF